MIIGWLAGIIISKRPALTVPYARMIAKNLLVLAAILAAVAGFFIWLNNHNSEIIDAHKEKVLQDGTKAREVAGEVRVGDVLANAKSEEELHDAIDAAPSGAAPSPAAIALACKRLSKLGRFPPGCGPQDGNGAQASPR